MWSGSLVFLWRWVVGEKGDDGMEREKEIEKKLKAAVEKEGGLCFKFLSSVSGVPDRICLFDGGVIVFVELKAPGRKPRKLRNQRRSEVRKVGCWAV